MHKIQSKLQKNPIVETGKPFKIPISAKIRTRAVLFLFMRIVQIRIGVIPFVIFILPSAQVARIGWN